MLPAKIKLSDYIIHNIKTARIAKRIPASALSKAIKRDDSYISSLELKRLRTISSADLTAIICILFDVPEHIAIKKAEEFNSMEEYANSNINQSLQYPVFSEAGNSVLAVSESGPERHWYDAKSVYAEPELISDMLDVLTGLITETYEREPKEAVFMLNSFIKTLQFDPVFAMGVLEIPFFALKTLSVDERKEVLADLSAVFEKHAAIANQK